MDYLTGQSSASHYEYVVDRRIGVYQLKQEALFSNWFLQGWCSLQKADFLIDLVLKMKPKKVVEIGVWGGKSLIPIAYALRENKSGTIYGIDPWDGDVSSQYIQLQSNKTWWQLVDHGLIYKDLVQKLEEYQLLGHVQLIPLTSEEAPDIGEIDILHIDGNHSEETSFYDVQKWVPLVKKGGMIIFDDMSWVENGRYTTEKAVRFLDANCKKIAEFKDVCDWGVWVK